MNTSWDDTQIFMAVAHTGSFSAAAKMLGVGQPTVSRRVAALEEHTGGPLFRRGRRGVELTSAGERLLPAAQAMAQHARDFDALLARYSNVPRGTVRIAAPPGIALDVLVPFAQELRLQEPDIQLEIMSDITAVDLTRGEADLALRNHAPSEKDVECLWQFEATVRAHASQEYAAQLPADPTLADIDWITFSHPFEHLPPGPQLQEAIEGFRPAFSSNSFVIQLEAARRGIGAMFLPYGLHGERTGRGLIPLDLELSPILGWAYLLAPKRARWVPRVHAVSQALTRYLESTIMAEMKPSG